MKHTALCDQVSMMQLSEQARQLNLRSLSYIRSLFTTLRPPGLNKLRGKLQAEFVGPAWLRRIAGPSLKLAGLGGWWGKVFEAKATGINLVCREKYLHRLFPFQIVQIPLWIDGKPGISIQYTKDCPFPWPLMTDELRWLDDTCMLGLNYANMRVLRKIVFPFLLHAQV